MTKKEWLLIQLASEANEVAHAVSKVLQFGAADTYEGRNPLAAIDVLLSELDDFHGAVASCIKHEVFYIGSELESAIAKKLEKIEDMYEYAKQKGVVE